MSEPVKVIHYVNQFFGGIGGEEQAGVGVSVQEGPVAAGRALQQALGDVGQVVATIICGDNYFSENGEAALGEIEKYLKAREPDLVIAGPAFAAGRYGLACGQVCSLAEGHGLPAVTGMHRDNPAVHPYRKETIIVPTGETPADMADAMAAMVGLGLKRYRGEELGPAEVEGYISTGVRRVHDRGRPGYQRALDMLLDKLHGRPFTTEVPIYAPEKVAPAPPLADVGKATLAMVTTGGLVKKGNPERQVAANATRYHRHSVKELDALSGKDWEAYHAGYFNHIVNANPNYILPLNFLRDLEGRGAVGAVHEWIYALPGVSTPVAMSTAFGRTIAEELTSDKVDGVLLVAT
jgi:glycine reductase